MIFERTPVILINFSQSEDGRYRALICIMRNEKIVYFLTWFKNILSSQSHYFCIIYVYCGGGVHKMPLVDDDTVHVAQSM